MKFGSLFAGIGGFDLGFERASMQCAWQVEIDPGCLSVLGAHWPEARRYGDVSTISGRELPAVDLVAGGFPCQDVSVAGRRAGLAGERSGLWFEFHRILEEHRPAWVVIENVPGLLSSRRGRDFAVILRGLAELGYGVAWRILDAQHFGVPQRRRRVFIVGHLGDYRAVEVLFEPESLRGDTAAGREARSDIAYALAAGAGGSKFGSGRERQDTFVFDWQSGGDARGLKAQDTAMLHASQVPVVFGTVTGAEAHNGNSNPIAENYIVNALSPKRGGDDDNDAQAGHLIAAPLRSRQHPNSNMPGRGGEDDENLVFGFTHSGYSNQPAWLTNDRVDAIPAGGQHPSSHQGIGVIEPVGVRRLTPTECERLQGFPDGHTEGHSDSQRYRMLGNAVCVPVAEWLARRIVQLNERNPQ